MEVIKLLSWTQNLPLKFTGIIHWPDGQIEYFLNGKTHRDDGPALITSNYQYWILNDECYETKEKWFNALTPEQQFNALWSTDIWR